MEKTIENNNNIIQIKVQNPVIKTGLKKYVTYEIETTIQENQKISVDKRYSEFLQNYNLWKSILPEDILETLPTMPKKELFNKFSTEVVEHRRSKFDIILNYCIKIPHLITSKYFQRFLGIKEYMTNELMEMYLKLLKENKKLEKKEEEKKEKVKNVEKKNIIEEKKENTVSIEEYENIVKERDLLKIKVENLESENIMLKKQIEKFQMEKVNI